MSFLKIELMVDVLLFLAALDGKHGHNVMADRSWMHSVTEST